jgi:hypothetical protein
MPKVKYDLSEVEDLPDIPHAPVGTYIGKIEAVDARDSSKGNPMLEVRWILTHNADGTRLKEEFQPLWDYPILKHDNKFVMAKTKDFFTGIGVKLKGVLDTDKVVGAKAQLKLRSDTDQDGEYRPRIGKIMPVGSPNGASAEVEEPEPDEPEPAAEEEEGVDLAELDRDELKAFIRSEKLGTLADLGIKKSTTDDEIRDIIAGKMGLEQEEAEEEEPEDDEADADADAANAEADGDGYDDMSQADLVKEFKERELDPVETDVKGKKGAALKTALIEALRADDASSPF